MSGKIVTNSILQAHSFALEINRATKCMKGSVFSRGSADGGIINAARLSEIISFRNNKNGARVLQKCSAKATQLAGKKANPARSRPLQPGLLKIT
jgi:hypothetical protein